MIVIGALVFSSASNHVRNVRAAFWPCRYQIEVARSYQIETKQDHA